MKPLSQHIQETLTNNSLKEVFVEKLLDEQLDALERVAPVEKASTNDGSTLLATVVRSTS